MSATIIMAHLIKHRIPLLMLTLFFLFSFPVVAENAALTNIIVTNNRDDLLLYLDVEGAFKEDMKNAIESGVPTTFSFYITLHKIRSFWVNKKIADITVTHTIKYNNLKKEFVVVRSWEAGKSVITRSFEEAQKLMSEIKNLHIISLDKLKKGSQYKIKAKAKLSKMTLPYSLHYVLVFVSLWDFETDWYAIDFIY